jgi:hypothetical protein
MKLFRTSLVRVAIAAAALCSLTLPACAEGVSRISGTIVGARNEPLPGVTVSVTSPSSADIRAVTDRRGFFSVLGVGNGQARLVVEKQGYAPCWSDLGLDSGDNLYLQVQLFTSIPPAPMDGRCYPSAAWAEPFDRYVVH